MDKKILFKVMLFVLGVMLVLQACNFPSTSAADGEDLSALEKAQTIVAQTAVAGERNGGNDPGSGAHSGPENGADPPEPPTPTITETLVPAITLTPTLETPMASVSVDTNCRTGPGKVYDYIGALLVGETAEVVGQSTDGLYWIIKNPDRAGNCWLWGNYASVAGSTANFPKYTPPPTPTPTFVWQGSWTLFAGDPGGNFIDLPLTVNINDKTLIASITDGGEAVTFTGTISDDGLSVNGNYSGPDTDGTFEWFALGTDQFQGNGEGATGPYAMCGGRGGAGQPSPCLKN
jgi:hypothetical protein